MGRLKVYGGSWNLPGVKDLPNPFSEHFNVAPEAVTGFTPLPASPEYRNMPVVETAIVVDRPVVQRPVDTLTQVAPHTSGAETTSRYIILGGVLIHYSVYN